MKIPSEHKLQVMLLDYLERAARKDCYWFAIPNQANRGIMNAVRMKAEGLRSGIADICIMLPEGKACWLEMKKPGGSLSAPQKVFRYRCEQLGHPWAMARSLDEAIPHLREWGVLKR
jgi:hypothetical protein